MDECYKAEAFRQKEEVKKGKKDGRASIRKEDEADTSISRSNASVFREEVFPIKTIYLLHQLLNKLLLRQ